MPAMRYLALVLVVGCVTRAPADPHRKAWKLVWSDEFAYEGKPDPAKWSYETGDGGPDGWGNQEAEYYTGADADNAIVHDGHLIIEARHEARGGKQYTSARLVTKGKAEWQYGRIEVRAKLPKGRGTWPAIWMLAATTPLHWPDDGEIDIMEHVGFDPAMVHASIHCKKYYHVINTQKTSITPVNDFGDAFHVYAMEWDADSIAIYADELEYLRFRNEHTGYAAWPFDQRFFVLLNVAVGGFWGGKQGIDDSIFPQRMEIDYVRVYQ
jgi:beta-glucanase (GH16 family)